MDIAAQNNDIDALYALIGQNQGILNDIDEMSFVNTPLHIAAFLGNIEFAMEMMNLKPSFATKLNQDGFTPLHLALKNNQQQMVRLLVNAYQSLVRVKGREGITPLHQAASANNIDALAEFLVACPECIVDVNIRGETALHIAARRDNVEPLKILVHWLTRNSHKKGYFWQDEVLNSKDNEGNTVLHVAAINNHPQMIRLLLNSSIGKNHINSENWTPLDILQNHQANTDHARRILERAGGLNGAALPKHPTLPEFLQSDISYCELMYKSVVRQRKNLSDHTRNALLVVAGLILTATYQASLNPPAGFSQVSGSSTGDSDSDSTSTNSRLQGFIDAWTVEDNRLGKSVMNSAVFLAFYSLNTLSFFLTSLVTLQFLIAGPPIISFALFLSLGSLFGCYVYATLVISPTVGYVIVLIVFTLLILPTRLWVPWISHYENYLDKKYRYIHDQDGGFWSLY